LGNDRQAKEFKEKGAEIRRESGETPVRLATIFIKNFGGLEMDTKAPR
jgi:hypothetical protein